MLIYESVPAYQSPDVLMVTLYVVGPGIGSGVGPPGTIGGFVVVIPGGFMVDTPGGFMVDAPGGFMVDIPGGFTVDIPGGLMVDAPGGFMVGPPGDTTRLRVVAICA